MRLEDALADNHHIYGVILGSAVNNDASLKAGYTAPSVEGQLQVIRQAQAVAGVDAADVSYVEAHGTATGVGDAVELAALTKVFRATSREVGFCGLGSVKSNIGHLSTAAGVAGLIKTALALEHAIIPPTLNFSQPNPDLNLATSPFYVASELGPWRTPPGQPRRAGVSSFGVGGTNAHLVLQEPPLNPSGPTQRPWHVLLLSARSEAALERAGQDLRQHLLAHPEVALADVAYTLQVGRRGFEQRRALVCADRDDALSALEKLDAERVVSKKAPSAPAQIVFMFPGQGTQYSGMGAELYQREPTFRRHADECFAAMPKEFAARLKAILYPESGGSDRADRAPAGHGAGPAGAVRHRVRPGAHAGSVGTSRLGDDRPQHRRVCRRLLERRAHARRCAAAGGGARPHDAGDAGRRDALGGDHARGADAAPDR